MTSFIPENTIDSIHAAIQQCNWSCIDDAKKITEQFKQLPLLTNRPLYESTLDLSLIYATSRGSLEVIELLMGDGANNYCRIMEFAAKEGYTDLVIKMLDKNECKCHESSDYDNLIACSSRIKSIFEGLRNKNIPIAQMIFAKILDCLKIKTMVSDKFTQLVYLFRDYITTLPNLDEYKGVKYDMNRDEERKVAHEMINKLFECGNSLSEKISYPKHKVVLWLLDNGLSIKYLSKVKRINILMDIIDKRKDEMRIVLYDVLVQDVIGIVSDYMIY